MNILTSVPVLFTWTLLLLCQIVVLNKTKERMQPSQSNQEEEDPDIKKIKKVKRWFHTRPRGSNQSDIQSLHSTNDLFRINFFLPSTKSEQISPTD